MEPPIDNVYTCECTGCGKQFENLIGSSGSLCQDCFEKTQPTAEESVTDERIRELIDIYQQRITDYDLKTFGQLLWNECADLVNVCKELQSLRATVATKDGEIKELKKRLESALRDHLTDKISPVELEREILKATTLSKRMEINE